MRRKYQLYGKNRKVFLDGLQKYWERGVVIRIDGKVADASDWIKILEIQADGSFYMGDYIMDEQKALPTASVICEEARDYGSLKPELADTHQKGDDETKITCPEQYCAGALKEIRFDRVYNR